MRNIFCVHDARRQLRSWAMGRILSLLTEGDVSQRVGDFIRQSTVVDVLVFQVGHHLGVEVVELLSDAADGGDHQVVGEHRRDSHEETDDRGDECTRDTRGHRSEARAGRHRDTGEGFHNTPDRAEKTDEGTARNGRGQDDQANR